MSFTYSLSTNVGKVRLLIQDNVQSTAQFSDEELTELLSQNGGSVYMTAAAACRSLATKYALKAMSKSAGNYSESKAGIYKAYMDMAKNFDELAIQEPADAQVETIFTDFNYEEISRNKVLRGESLDD